jgi:hypothetical protein
MKYTNETFRHNPETGIAELVETNVVEISVEDLIKDKEDKLLEMYKELEELKNR